MTLFLILIMALSLARCWTCLFALHDPDFLRGVTPRGLLFTFAVNCATFLWACGLLIGSAL